MKEPRPLPPRPPNKKKGNKGTTGHPRGGPIIRFLREEGSMEAGCPGNLRKSFGSLRERVLGNLGLPPLNALSPKP